MDEIGQEGNLQPEAKKSAGSTQSPEVKPRSVIIKALSETLKFIMPIAIVASESLERNRRFYAGEPENLNPKFRLEHPIFTVPDTLRYIAVLNSIQNLGGNPAVLASTLGILLSPNVIHLVSKNRLVVETTEMVGKSLAKGAKAVLRNVPLPR